MASKDFALQQLLRAYRKGIISDELFAGKCCNFENGDRGGPERNWAARFQAARLNSWSMN
jgi:hypothetical protein